MVLVRYRRDRGTLTFSSAPIDCDRTTHFDRARHYRYLGHLLSRAFAILAPIQRTKGALWRRGNTLTLSRKCQAVAPALARSRGYGAPRLEREWTEVAWQLN